MGIKDKDANEDECNDSATRESGNQERSLFVSGAAGINTRQYTRRHSRRRYQHCQACTRNEPSILNTPRETLHLVHLWSCFGFFDCFSKSFLLQQCYSKVTMRMLQKVQPVPARLLPYPWFACLIARSKSFSRSFFVIWRSHQLNQGDGVRKCRTKRREKDMKVSNHLGNFTSEICRALVELGRNFIQRR